MVILTLQVPSLALAILAAMAKALAAAEPFASLCRDWEQGPGWRKDLELGLHMDFALN